jgi:NitT/TauT family transport system ATP-binding protein
VTVGDGALVRAMDRTPSADEEVLQLSGIAVAYGSGNTRKEVISGLDLSVRRGEFLCVVGPSGVGKSTVIRCVAGLLRPTSGTVSLLGRVVDEPPRDLALVSQDYSRSLMPWLKVIDNCRLPLRGKRVPKQEQLDRVREALQSVGLSGVERSYPWQLSGGMQQRVSIARALAYRPQVLVMDEPFASVDAQIRADLEDLVLRLQRESGITILLVTHDIDEAAYLADRVVVLGGTPASIVGEVRVGLGRDRDQLSTKSSPDWIRYRNEILVSVRELVNSRPQ